ncbi:hypothetical protein [Larkinella sp.]|uniref:hypothetical protein n=1 Tax=Larkinella sp. TaxID=2034517 RepID=UPI003BAA0605
MHALYRFLLPSCFLILLGSCTVQDHLNPEESNPCRVSYMLNQLDTYLIPPGETVTLGQQVTGISGSYFIVADILELNGQLYAVSGKSEVARTGGEESNAAFEYDSQGRLSKAVIRYRRPTATITTVYEYLSPTELQITQTDDYGTYPVPPSSTKIVPLNSLGLVIDPNVTYDAEGYVTRRGSTNYNIVNGNDIGTDAERYEYDLTKPNPIPNPFFFNGKKDKNLRTDIISLDTSTKTEFDLKYIYDDQGNLKYDILMFNYPDTDPRMRVHINKYEWSCPQ